VGLLSVTLVGLGGGATPAGAAPTTCLGKPVTISGSGTITGTSGPDVIVGSSGPDVVKGLGGNDTIFDDPGDTVLHVP
jgi:hypothetical protein